jgi:glycosyltransferase involved in cell wall biosynthesis
VSGRVRGLFVLSDKLESPPRLGLQVHLSSLVRAAAAHVPTRGFAWAAPSPDLPPGLVAVDPETAPAGNLARKRHYLARAFEVVDREAAPGSVAWVRDWSTAALALPGLRRRRRAGLVSLFDASSFQRLEVPYASGRAAAWLRGLAEELLWSRFDRVRTLNGPMRDYLVAHGVPAERILVVPVGAELPAEGWRPRAAAWRLLYVGSALAWQGLPDLVAAMRVIERRAPQVLLSVAGPSPAELAALEPPGNVVGLGRVPHDGIGRVYLDHDLLVLSRPRTPLTEIVTPMKIPEAMAHGMPILSTDLEAVRWVTGDDGAFLVRGTGPEELAGALLSALADPAALAATGARARERAARFAWDEIGRTIARELFA